jgi:hypothetical protein
MAGFDKLMTRGIFHTMTVPVIEHDWFWFHAHDVAMGATKLRQSR